MGPPIFHVAEARLWDRAAAEGSYTCSTRDASLTEVGYIHCSFRHQVETVANYIYGDWDGDLLLLEVDPDCIPSEIRVENLDSGSEGFPHIYGPLPAAAVKAVHQLARVSGRYRLPSDL
jgi:uncharacterized protein (DUF952 family)